MVHPPPGPGDSAGEPADPNLPSWAETRGPATAVTVASAASSAVACRVIAASVRNHHGVARLQIDGSAAADRALVVECDRLDAGGGASQDADILRVGEVLQSAGDRERLQHREPPAL